MENNISILQISQEKSIVIIPDIRFRGKRKIDWNDVENYLKQYIGKSCEIPNTKELIYIGKDFPGEYSGSQDTARLKGALAKAKANAAMGIIELVKTAANKRYKENLAAKHSVNAKYGWYRYDSRFVKRNNISYNMSLPIWRAIFLPCPKKPYSAGFAAMQ